MKIEPDRTALVLIDFQPAILSSLGPAANAVLSHAEVALRWARGAGLCVAHVRVAFRDADLDAIPARNKAFGALKGRGVFLDGTPGYDIAERLRPDADEIVVRKTRFGAFSTTDLHDQLRDAGIETLVAAGIRTGGALLATVLDAADRDYALYVLSDACADADVDLHDSLMSKVLPHRASVMSTADLDALVEH